MPPSCCGPHNACKPCQGTPRASSGHEEAARRRRAAQAQRGRRCRQPRRAHGRRQAPGAARRTGRAHAAQAERRRKAHRPRSCRKGRRERLRRGRARPGQQPGRQLRTGAPHAHLVSGTRSTRERGPDRACAGQVPGTGEELHATGPLLQFLGCDPAVGAWRGSVLLLLPPAQGAVLAAQPTMAVLDEGARSPLLRSPPAVPTSALLAGEACSRPRRRRARACRQDGQRAARAPGRVRRLGVLAL